MQNKKHNGSPIDSGHEKTVLVRNVTEEQLNAAIEKSRHHRMTKEEREAQRVSFVWGNAPEGDDGTFETVRQHLHLI